MPRPADSQSFKNPPGPRPDLSDPGNPSSTLKGQAPNQKAYNYAADAPDTQHVLPSDFRLNNLQAGVKGENYAEPVRQPREPELGRTVGRYTDDERVGMHAQRPRYEYDPNDERIEEQSHDIDLPATKPHMPPRPTGEADRTKVHRGGAY